MLSLPSPAPSLPLRRSASPSLTAPLRPRARKPPACRADGGGGGARRQKVPPREIIVRGPGRIVEYMERVRKADLECWRCTADTPPPPLRAHRATRRLLLLQVGSKSKSKRNRQRPC